MTNLSVYQSFAPVRPGRALAMRAAGPGWSGECAGQPDPRLFTRFCRPGRTRLSCQANRPGHGASQSAGSRQSGRAARGNARASPAGPRAGNARGRSRLVWRMCATAKPALAGPFLPARPLSQILFFRNSFYL